MMTVTAFDLFGFSIAGAIIITMALGIVLSAFMPLDRWSKRYFIAMFSLMFLLSVFCFFCSSGTIPLWLPRQKSTIC